MHRFLRQSLLCTAAGLALGLPVSAQDGTGFVISIDDKPVAGDPAIKPKRKPKPETRRQDVELAKADVQVRFDGLDVQPRLHAVVLNGRPPRPGEQARVQSQLNYPAFVERAEIRVIRLNAPGGARTLSVLPVDPNGVATFTVPDGDIAVVHRVYDAKGRYDETGPIAIRASDRAGQDIDHDRLPETGVDSAARRRIPVYGGAVTVTGQNVRQGARVETLGETITPDPSGKFAIQRIYPSGDLPVAIQVRGAGEDTYLERDITIPRSEWFYTGIVDLTYGRRFSGGVAARGGSFNRDYTLGRIAGYAKGKTQSGWTITARADTGEVPLRDLFRDFDKKDPHNVLLRMAREDAYPTYGDDSTLVDGAPSRGKIYAKAEKNGSHILWGNYKSSISGSYYLRNERKLYGLQGVYRSQEQTSRGQSKASIEVYAANPDNLPGRDVFKGTGGSLYFLQRQDISIGSESLSVELRDRDTGRVLGTRTLVAGRDYQINYVQGHITLSAPLTGSTGGGVVITNPGGEVDVHLVAQYEYTPAAGDIKGWAYGGRAEAWLGDHLRIGITGQVEQTDVADQTARGVDLRYELSERSHIDLEYAETRGPGFGSSFSADGGLIITNTATSGTAGGTGKAYRGAFRFDLQDLGSQSPGHVAGYYEQRTAGFSTLDHQTTVGEELWGLSVDMQPSEDLGWRLYYDDYTNKAGKIAREGGVELRYRASERVKWEAGIEHVDRTTPGGTAVQNGSRTDAALRLTLTQSDQLEWYVYGQATLQRSGGLRENNRLGAGVRYRFAENWTFEGDVSDGSLGLAGKALFTYQRNGYDSAYFGYRLEPGRELAGVSLLGRDQGQFVAGGKRRLGENVDVYGENTYDMFGRHRSLTSTYGVEYRTSEQLTVFGSFEAGRIQDPGGNFDRNAVSLGLRYSDKDRLTARARVEYRKDRGVISGTNRDQDAILFAASAAYRINENSRMVLNLEYADTNNATNSILSGKYIDGVIGYAHRPLLDDKLNLLFKYRYLYDMIGQEIDGTSTRGPRQESHVLTVDMDYDLNQKWTLGAKIGGRLSRSAPNGTAALARNDAWLGVVNLRYHATHKWDLLLEGRMLKAHQAGTRDIGILAAGYRHVGQNLKLGLGYNFGRFSDDLTDLTYDDKGMFINLIAKF